MYRLIVKSSNIVMIADKEFTDDNETVMEFPTFSHLTESLETFVSAVKGSCVKFEIEKVEDLVCVGEELTNE